MADNPGEGKQSGSAEYNALIAMAEDLCNALPISDHDLLPQLNSNCVISSQEKTEIRNVPTDRGKVQLLISVLTTEMASGENERFYKFLETMKKSPECSFLVERMERWISHYKQLQLVSSDVEATPSSLTVQLATNGSQKLTGNSTSPHQSPTTVIQQQMHQDDATSTDGHSLIDMELVHKHVIPKINEEWETVCDHLEYSLAIKNIISRTNNGSSTECCTALLKDWVTSDNGVKPKTWKKLIEVLNEISSLAVVTKQIKQCLYKEGVIAGVDDTAVQQQNGVSSQQIFMVDIEFPLPVSAVSQSSKTTTVNAPEEITVITTSNPQEVNGPRSESVTVSPTASEFTVTVEGNSHPTTLDVASSQPVNSVESYSVRLTHTAGSEDSESISNTENKEGRGIGGISQDENVRHSPDVQDGQYGYRDDGKKDDQIDSEYNNNDQRNNNSEGINQAISENGQQEDTTHQRNAAETLLGGLTWTVLTCSTGMMGYVIGEDVGAFTGALCAVVTGVVCIDHVIQWGCRVKH